MAIDFELATSRKSVDGLTNALILNIKYLLYLLKAEIVLNRMQMQTNIEVIYA